MYYYVGRGDVPLINSKPRLLSAPASPLLAQPNHAGIQGPHNRRARCGGEEEEEEVVEGGGRRRLRHKTLNLCEQQNVEAERSEAAGEGYERI